ncbi:MAG: hypothetical protein NC416_18930 [Eubacterium sp.]|nr:hypothetical protein [Eubacterium sp.]
MKKHIKVKKVCMIACLVLGIMVVSSSRMKVQAAEVIATVQGSVMTGTTTELLKLATKEGNMEIKLDSGTDASACKVLLPGSNINVSVSHGSDGYLHAVKITTGAQASTVTLDSSTGATVTGTISDKTKDDVLVVKTPQGEMQIKLDTTTNLSGCTVLVVDKTYSITCVRGSDAYMHATSITDASGVSLGSSASTTPISSLTPAPESPVNASTSTVTGTVNKKTKDNLLYLSTNAGEMQIVIDANTDSRNGMFLMPGRTLIVSVYRGSDAYMHAATIIGVKDGVLPASVDTSSTSTVSGTVNSKSTENILYLNTSAGEMELKLDVVRSVSGCKVLVADRKITVTCARGSDAYMHAVDIIGN